jgi:hypothetical protein
MMIVSCDTKPYDTSLYTIDKVNSSTGEISLIEHPYIFGDLDLKLESFTYKRTGSDVTFKAVMDGDVDNYQNCILFCHGYQSSQRNEMKNMDLSTLKIGEKLVFNRTILIDSTYFEEIRVGLVCSDKENRLFKLKLEKVYIN